MELLKEIPLSEITVTGRNARTVFDGAEFDKLQESIAKQGVLQPILVRPTDSGYELIAGERRFRAKINIVKANGGIEASSIPAIVKNMTDDEAFEAMMIENLHREDLTVLEEAKGFAEFMKGRPKEAIKDLAEKVSVSTGYIRSRVEVLSLPKAVLKDWESNKITFGHLKQLLRLPSKKAQAETYESFTNSYKQSVASLKQMINNMAPILSKAVFNTKAAGCAKCRHNSSIQSKLFDIDMDKSICHDPDCFKAKSKEHLDLHFKKTKTAKDNGTTGYRFYGETPWEEINKFGWQDSPKKKCKSCDDFISLLSIDGKVLHDFVCIGPKKCFSETAPKQKPVTVAKAVSTGPDKPRVAWHGSFYRDKFFQEKTPAAIEKISIDDDRLDRMSLFFLMDENYEARHAAIATMDSETINAGHTKTNAVMGFVESLTKEQVRIALRAAIAAHTMDTRRNNSTEVRRFVGGLAGIDIKNEFAPDEEYLKKKKKEELIEFGKEIGIFKDEDVKQFIMKAFGSADHNSLKKGQLVKVFIESGFDMTGKVPDEILNFEGEQRCYSPPKTD